MLPRCEDPDTYRNFLKFNFIIINTIIIIIINIININIIISFNFNKNIYNLLINRIKKLIYSWNDPDGVMLFDKFGNPDSSWYLKYYLTIHFEFG